MRSFGEVLKEYNGIVRNDLVGFLERKYNFRDMLKQYGYRERVAVDLESISINDLILGMDLYSRLEVYIGGELFRCIIMATKELEKKYTLYDLNKNKRIDIGEDMFVFFEL